MTQIQAASPACTELETIVLDWLGKCKNEDFDLYVNVSRIKLT